MMGHRQVEQAALFYEFSLERHIPADHLLRSIDRFVELGDLRRELAPFYSSMGRPSIDPELMIRMLIIGYCFDDFTYDHERDAYLCPGGTMLTTTGTLVNDGATMLYRASKRDCTDCALKPHCCPRSRPGRCHAQSTKTLVIWRARLQSLGKVEYLDDSARRSRCCLRTSSGYSSWIDFDCEDRVAPAMSSSSQQPPRTFGSWPSWYRCPT